MNINLKLAVKNLFKAKITSTLNLLGLIMAFTAFIIIALYVWTEYHFDSYHSNADELYRVEIRSNKQEKSSVYLAGGTGQLLVDEIPEITAYTTYMPWGKWGAIPFETENEKGDKIETTEDYSFADENLTKLFSFDFIDQLNEQPLKDAGTAIIAAGFANKTWGKTQVAGKRFTMNKQTYTVSGVFKDLPANTVFTAPIILKMPDKGWISKAFKNWGVVNYPQFILVKKGTDPVLLNKKINEQSSLKQKYSYYAKNGLKLVVKAQALKNLRFTDDTAESPLFNSNSKKTVTAIGFVGILILFIALINYLNFSVALIPQRIKNVSISRIMGSSLKSLFATASFESSVLFIISILSSIVVFSYLNESLLQDLVGYAFEINNYWGLIAAISAVLVLLGVVIGLYPAFLSVKVNPTEGIKSYKKQSNTTVRGILSIVQFTATIALIAVSSLIIKQIYFMQNTDVGFNKDAVLFMPLNKELREKSDVFAKELKASPYVVDVGLSARVPGVASNVNSYQCKDKSVSAWTNMVDGKYMEIMNFEIVDGRAFIPESEAEFGNIICNETAARQFDWKVGDLISHNGLEKKSIVGIVKDFNFTALRNEVEPYVFSFITNKNVYSNLSIKLNGKNTTEALSFIKKTYKDLDIDRPFQYQFLDEHMNMQYAGENRQAKIIIIFSFISLIISLLGILGLSIFAAQRRTKEIGIRKVNGATIAEILKLLNTAFIKWVVIAFVIATPIAYYIADKWLENFAYKTALSWWIFALAGISALSIALLTVSWQSWKAASRNPVEALRYE